MRNELHAIHHSPVVTYNPDKDSAYGQSLRPAAPQKAWGAIQSFLANCENVRGPQRIELQANWADEFDANPQIIKQAEQCVTLAAEHFGTGMVSRYRCSPQGIERPQGMDWRVPEQRFHEFLDFLLSGDPWPQVATGPTMSLSFTFDFLWRDLKTHEPIAEQLGGHATSDGVLRSNLFIHLQRNSSVQPDLWFPFSHDDPRLITLVRHVSTILPFQLKARHFRAAIPGPKGQYVFKRLDIISS